MYKDDKHTYTQQGEKYFDMRPPQQSNYSRVRTAESPFPVQLSLINHRLLYQPAVEQFDSFPFPSPQLTFTTKLEHCARFTFESQLEEFLAASLRKASQSYYEQTRHPKRHRRVNSSHHRMQPIQPALLPEQPSSIALPDDCPCTLAILPPSALTSPSIGTLRTPYSS